MKIGYARVSTTAQNTDRQIDALCNAGCDKVFIDKFTGAKSDRPQLNKMFEQLRTGDIIIVTELARFGRNTKDLISLVEKIYSVGAEFQSLKETMIDTTTPQGKLIFTIFSAVAEFERDIIVMRTKDGLLSARARGRNGGRPAADSKAIDKAIKLYHTNTHTVTEITDITGVSKSTLYKYLSIKRKS